MNIVQLCTFFLKTGCMGCLIAHIRQFKVKMQTLFFSLSQISMLVQYNQKIFVIKVTYKT